MDLHDITHPLYYALNTAEVITPRAHGIDVSKYDIDFDPSTTNKQLDFVVQRSSYRLTKDQAFDEMIEGVLQVPIRMAYHYYNYGYSGDGTWQDQVTFMLNVIKGLPFHATAWDLEESFNVLNQQMAINSYYAVQELEQRTGNPAFLYTSLGVWNSVVYPALIAKGIDPKSIKLWLAQWLFTPNPNGTPSTPKGRESMAKSWDLWQYTDKGSGYGTLRNYPTDLDVFNGTVAEMKSFLSIGGVVDPPPTTGETMYYKCVKDVSIREDLNYPNNAVIGLLKVGDVVRGEMLTNVNATIPNWVHFDKIWLGGVTPELLDGYSSGYTTYLQVDAGFVEPDAPPSGGLPPLLSAQFVDGAGVEWQISNVEMTKVIK